MIISYSTLDNDRVDTVLVGGVGVLASRTTLANLLTGRSARSEGCAAREWGAGKGCVGCHAAA